MTIKEQIDRILSQVANVRWIHGRGQIIEDGIVIPLRKIRDEVHILQDKLCEAEAEIKRLEDDAKASYEDSH